MGRGRGGGEMCSHTLGPSEKNKPHNGQLISTSDSIF